MGNRSKLNSGYVLLIGGQCSSSNADLYECEELSPSSAEESEGGQSTLSSRRVRQDDIVSTGANL